MQATQPAAINCIILNISADGAKLRLLGSDELPQFFKVVVDLYGAYPAELAWRKGNMIGVRFLGDVTPIAKVIEQAVSADPES